MADLKYRRAEKDEHERLREFVLGNFRRKSEDSIGCREDQLSGSIEGMLLKYEGLVYIVAEDEKDVVGVYVVEVHPRSLPGTHLRIIALAISAEYDANALYYNMNVALTEFIRWPGCCGDSWSALFPPGPALDFISATEFGEGLKAEEHRSGLVVHVTARKPSQDLKHTDVPLAGEKKMTAEEVKAAQAALDAKGELGAEIKVTRDGR